MSILGFGDRFKFLVLDYNGQTHEVEMQDPTAWERAADNVLAFTLLLTGLLVIAVGTF